jgi:hypothetical protein
MDGCFVHDLSESFLLVNTHPLSSCLLVLMGTNCGMVSAFTARQMAAGDQYRVMYDNLSKDPNSLANLDQDLPNYAQTTIPIFSLPQEWLWCESWCGNETKAKVHCGQGQELFWSQPDSWMAIIAQCARACNVLEQMHLLQDMGATHCASLCRDRQTCRLLWNCRPKQMIWLLYLNCLVVATGL